MLKCEVDIEIKSSPDVFMGIFGKNKDKLPIICPNIITRIDLLEGEWGVPGSVILIHFVIGGKPVISKERLEEFDEEKKTFLYKVIDGDILKILKTAQITFQSSKIGETDIIKWNMGFEKMNEDQDVEEIMKNLIEFGKGVVKGVDDYYIKLSQNV